MPELQGHRRGERGPRASPLQNLWRELYAAAFWSRSMSEMFVDVHDTDGQRRALQFLFS